MNDLLALLALGDLKTRGDAHEFPIHTDSAHVVEDGMNVGNVQARAESVVWADENGRVVDLDHGCQAVGDQQLFDLCKCRLQLRIVIGAAFGDDCPNGWDQILQHFLQALGHGVSLEGSRGLARAREGLAKGLAKKISARGLA